MRHALYYIPSGNRPFHRPEGVLSVAEEILIGDVITTRKSHPCGSDRWTVIRTGADIKIRCSGCGRIVMLDRESFLRRRKAIISRVEPAPESCQ